MRTWPGSMGEKSSKARVSVLWMRRLMGGDRTRVPSKPGGYNAAQYIAPVGASGLDHRHLMTQVTVLAHALRLLALACVLLVPPAALADEYADVNQLLRSGKHAEALAKADQ